MLPSTSQEHAFNHKEFIILFSNKAFGLSLNLFRDALLERPENLEAMLTTLSALFMPTI